MESNWCRYDIQCIMDEMEAKDDEMGDLYKTYFQEVKENIQDVLELIPKEKWEEIDRILHNLKGVSINLNIVDVYKSVSSFSEIVKKRDVENFEDYIKDLTVLVKNAEAEVKTFFLKKGISI